MYEKYSMDDCKILLFCTLRYHCVNFCYKNDTVVM